MSSRRILTELAQLLGVQYEHVLPKLAALKAEIERMKVELKS